MAEQSEKDIILLVDEMPLRRAIALRFLERWAADAGLVITGNSLDDAAALRQPIRIRLVVLSIGGESLEDPRMVAVHRVLTGLHPNLPVIVLGDRPDTGNVEYGLRLGIVGYIPTSLEAEVALAALDFILAGGSYFPPDALMLIGKDPHGAPPQEPRRISLLPSRVSPQDPLPDAPKSNGLKTNGGKENALGVAETKAAAKFAPTGDLTSRQREVLGCLKRALSNKVIARELNMSEATVKVHVRQVMKKLGAVNRTHAAVLAVDSETGAELLPSNVARFLTGSASMTRSLGH